MDQLNKLVREIYSSRYVSIRAQQLNYEYPERLVMVGYSDASLANRPHASSTGGHIFGFMHPEDFAKGTGKPRSSLSAEVQSLADLEQEMMLARLTWCELLGMEIALKNPASAARQIPAAMIIDAKAGYDVLDRDAVLSASVGIKDKYSTLELAARDLGSAVRFGPPVG